MKILTHAINSEIILVYTETEDEDEYFRKGFQESVRQVERTWTETGEMDFIRAD